MSRWVWVKCYLNWFTYRISKCKISFSFIQGCHSCLTCMEFSFTFIIIPRLLILPDYLSPSTYFGCLSVVFSSAFLPNLECFCFLLSSHPSQMPAWLTLTGHYLHGSQLLAARSYWNNHYTVLQYSLSVCSVQPQCSFCSQFGNCPSWSSVPPVPFSLSCLTGCFSCNSRPM